MYTNTACHKALTTSRCCSLRGFPSSEEGSNHSPTYLHNHHHWTNFCPVSCAWISKTTYGYPCLINIANRLRKQMPKALNPVAAIRPAHSYEPCIYISQDFPRNGWQNKRTRRSTHDSTFPFRIPLTGVSMPIQVGS